MYFQGDLGMSYNLQSCIIGVNSSLLMISQEPLKKIFSMFRVAFSWHYIHFGDLEFIFNMFFFLKELFSNDSVIETGQ